MGADPKVLSFSPLRLSDAGRYTCQATVSSPYLNSDITMMDTHDVILQSKHQPDVASSANYLLQCTHTVKVGGYREMGCLTTFPVTDVCLILLKLHGHSSLMLPCSPSSHSKYILTISGMIIILLSDLLMASSGWPRQV